MKCLQMRELEASRLALDDEIEALTQQLEEIRCYRENDKGKWRADDLPDNELGISAFLEEVTTSLGVLGDLKLAQSIANAVESDAQAVTAITEEEIQVEEDRRLAMRYSAEDAQPGSFAEADDDIAGDYSSLQSLYLGVNNGFMGDNGSETEIDDAGPSTTYTERQEEAMRRLSEVETCCACYDNFPLHRIQRLKCTDIYCDDCLKNIFAMATTDESLFPPKCCGEPIPLCFIQVKMSQHELDKFRNAEVEFSTSNRTYCCNSDCARFVPPKNIEADRATCHYCDSDTCVRCKSIYHDEDDCTADTELQATLELAKNMRWPRCYACRALVELTVGCYHINCKCTAQFCYLCGAKWKTCNCPQFEERRLYARPEGAAQAEANNRMLNIGQCPHNARFQRIDLNRQLGVCAECNSEHYLFLFRCRMCPMEVCIDCRRTHELAWVF
ncbi:hypothetical protein BDW74DRAFT_75581 [Aspergillus multicolor]|uniref:BRcat and Rcat domain-containing protein n=1 Tax=Aspergillus multicolor TaxID=41759 RepID=UPI003CCD5DDF